MCTGVKGWDHKQGDLTSLQTFLSPSLVAINTSPPSGYIYKVYKTSSLWCQNLGECHNVNLHGWRHIPEEGLDLSASCFNEPEQWNVLSTNNHIVIFTFKDTIHTGFHQRELHYWITVTSYRKQKATHSIQISSSYDFVLIKFTIRVSVKTQQQ